ncbi:hypothetical protein FQK02_01940 [Xanthomonas vasicola]|nr:hypothetical protein FQK02_01940 [Xanthomonas vasicola]
MWASPWRWPGVRFGIRDSGFGIRDWGLGIGDSSINGQDLKLRARIKARQHLQRLHSSVFSSCHRPFTQRSHIAIHRASSQTESPAVQGSLGSAAV